jgi:hypothetical protein
MADRDRVDQGSAQISLEAPSTTHRDKAGIDC